MQFLYIVPDGKVTIARVKSRKVKAGSTPKADAKPRGPVKFLPSGQADRYLVDDATLAAYLAAETSEARAEVLAKVEAGSSTTSPIHPTLDAWHAMLTRWTAQADALVASGGEAVPFDFALSEATRGILVIPRDDASGEPEPDIASLFVLPTPDTTPEPGEDDASDATPARKRG